MARWQYDFFVIPQRKEAPDFSENEMISWENTISISDIESALPENFPLQQSWSENIKLYGTEDSTCVTIVLKQNQVEEISYRLDLRSLTKTKLTEILHFIQKIHGEIYAEEKRIKPEINTVVSVMKISDTAKFCSDSENFFIQHEHS